ncbi:hypothetical protein NF699_06440 [Sphingomonadaceae bacterium OTU29LAMAA1]|nr:hypothetical protein NF699_06440 [Sphingomonadaceae bacterium OTU29LAMAA1]
MKHYQVTAELVDETSGKRFMPGDTFMPASEKQRVRLTNAGCLGDEEVDPLDGLGDLPLGTLSREHLENIAFGIARQTIAKASDDDLRDGIESHRERRATIEADDNDRGEGSGSGQSGGGASDDADDLDQQTVDQLKKIAEHEEVDLSGKTLKGAIVTAIRAARVERADAKRNEG